MFRSSSRHTVWVDRTVIEVIEAVVERDERANTRRRSRPMPNADGAGVDSLNTLPSHGRKGNGQGAGLVPTLAPWYQQNSEGHLCDITVCPPAADADPF